MKYYFWFTYLFLINLSVASQKMEAPIFVEEKFYYIGKNNIVTGWQGPWPVNQLDAIDDICEVIFQVDGITPEKIEHLKLNEDSTLKCPAEIDAARVAVADTEAADKLAMETAQKYISCGLRVKSRMLVQNSSKTLTSAQKISILTTYSTIDALLSSGSLATARGEILAVTADGVMIVEADKTALVAELDGCI